MNYNITVRPKMKEFVAGFSPLPQSYIEYHQHLARKVLDQFRAVPHVSVVRQALLRAGDMDGMFTIHAVLVYWDRESHPQVIEIKWLDCHETGSFFVRHEGWTTITEEPWSQFDQLVKRYKLDDNGCVVDATTIQ